MSRCFPFPPPGYEKRARVDDSDLLTKEKQKEKKHKKDKKDKEKREGKEKKNKERSRDKKKDRKEKKDKERDKDKQPECNNGENVEIKDSKYVQELARRIKDEDRAIGSQMVTDQSRVVLPEKVVETNNAKLFKDEKKINGFRNHIDPRYLENERNSFGVDQAGVDGKAKPADSNVEKTMEGKEKDKQNGGEKHKDKQNGGEKHKDRDKEKRSKSKDKDRKREKEKKEKVKKTEPSKEQPKDMTSSCIVKPSNNLNLGVIKEVEMKKEPTKELPKLKENINLSSGTRTCSDEGSLGKHKEVEMKKEPICSKDMPVISNIKLSNHVKEGIKSSNGEVVLGKRKEIEMKKEPVSKDIMSMPVVSNIKLSNHVKEGVKSSSNGEGILSKRKEIETKKEPMSKDIMSMPGFSSIKLSNHVKEGIKSSNGEGVLGKRKEPEMNRILNDNGTRPHKSPRLVTSSHPVVENGRKKEPTQFTERVEPEGQVATSKKQRINGSVNAQPPYESSKKPSHATTTPQANENGESCRKPKPPHPDSMYLNQILSIPKIEEVSDLDDQEWLFRSNNQQSKKPKVGSFEDRTSQVWAKGLQIESADIYALPYVTPY